MGVKLLDVESKSAKIPNSLYEEGWVGWGGVGKKRTTFSQFQCRPLVRVLGIHCKKMTRKFASQSE